MCFVNYKKMFIQDTEQINKFQWRREENKKYKFIN